MSDENTEKGPTDKSNTSADKLRARMEQLQSKLNAAKIAFYNNAELDGKVPAYEDLSRIAKELIGINYQLQKTLYGEVRLKLSVPKLLRASSR